jgi:hypothetical protein
MRYQEEYGADLLIIVVTTSLESDWGGLAKRGFSETVLAVNFGRSSVALGLGFKVVLEVVRPLRLMIGKIELHRLTKQF